MNRFIASVLYMYIHTAKEEGRRERGGKYIEEQEKKDEGERQKGREAEMKDIDQNSYYVPDKGCRGTIHNTQGRDIVCTRKRGKIPSKHYTIP